MPCGRLERQTNAELAQITGLRLCSGRSDIDALQQCSGAVLAGAAEGGEAPGADGRVYRERRHLIPYVGKILFERIASERQIQLLQAFCLKHLSEQQNMKLSRGILAK